MLLFCGHDTGHSLMARHVSFCGECIFKITRNFPLMDSVAGLVLITCSGGIGKLQCIINLNGIGRVESTWHASIKTKNHLQTAKNGANNKPNCRTTCAMLGSRSCFQRSLLWIFLVCSNTPNYSQKCVKKRRNVACRAKIQY